MSPSPSSSLSSFLSPSPTPSPSPSSFPPASSRDKIVSASSGSAPTETSKGSTELEALKSWHDVDSVVTEDLLRVLRDRYRILECYGLHTPRSGCDLHPVIRDCLHFWGISTSQVSPNSWCYMVAFIWECQGAGIDPSWSLFLACFHLGKGPGEYYLTAHSGFKISGVPSNNKGWKMHFFFISCAQEWGFSTGWAIRSIDNALPSISAGDTAMVDRLRGILSSSQVIKKMTEEWMVGAELSSTTGGMVIRI
ncbi:hypothetical protein C4D60_Mb11t07770 [Musa balbisiana]|uniref:Transposase (putative) gypsy type domain-containing protein n=1 Tax=Musa balbisiana TaxID=52838 RepID=A0A4S8J2K3_MUSBA|nr:hypothetical protein C4D60_Mb11t07770 [Musa balbisiana]